MPKSGKKKWRKSRRKPPHSRRDVPAVGRYPEHCVAPAGREPQQSRHGNFAERDWIASKDAEVLAAGLENEGGSLQPLLEATTAAELTKARVYELEQQSSILTETQGPDNISLIPAEAA